VPHIRGPVYPDQSKPLIVPPDAPVKHWKVLGVINKYHRAA
jgi:hypothetical protein